MSGMFRRSSVPGYVYGSELSGIERSNLRGHLVGRQVASHVAIEDGLGGVGWLKSLQAHGSHRSRHASSPFGPFLLRNTVEAPVQWILPLQHLTLVGLAVSVSARQAGGRARIGRSGTAH